MAINNTPVPDARLNMKIRSLFLDHLAQTANVAASARAAGVSSNACPCARGWRANRAHRCKRDAYHI
jgi:hypothetical protein